MERRTEQQPVWPGAATLPSAGWLGLFIVIPTLLTLGLFMFVINGSMFMLAAWLLDGFKVDTAPASRTSF